MVAWLPAPPAPAAHDHETIGVKSLDVYAKEGILHLLIGEIMAANQPAILRYFRSSDHGGSWSVPVVIDSAPGFPLARGRGSDFHLAASKNRIAVIWMNKGTGFMGRGPLATAYSDDGGKTWHSGGNPADDNSDGDHAFMDITADPAGNFHVVWLDKRENEGEDKGLRMTTSTDGGKSWKPNRTIDAATCECCWNYLTTDAHGKLYVLYRDIDPRDMSLSRSSDGGKSWESLGKVGAFDWFFNGCPHVGGSLAISANAQEKLLLHALVWTGMQDQVGVYYLQADASKMTWSAPQRLGAINAKFPDIAVNLEGVIAAVWMEYREDHSQILGATSTDNGVSWSSPKVLSSPTVNATHPRLATIGSDFQVFWSEIQEGNPSAWRHTLIK